MNKYLFAVLLCSNFSLAVLSAQQLPLFTQYREYYGYVNPASVSIDFYASNRREFYAFGASHRRQWIANSAFSSNTTVLRGESFFSPSSNFSFLLGGYLMNDNVGPTSFTGAYGRGALFVGNPEGSFFGLGFTAGPVVHTIDLNDLHSNEPEPLAYDKYATTVPDLGVGIFGSIDLDRRGDFALFLGASAPQLLEFDLQFSEGGQFDYKRQRHYYSHLGLYKKTSQGSDDYSFIEFSLWGKYVQGLPYHIDGNFRYQISTPVWIGFGASTTYNAHAELGFNIPNPNNSGFIRVGYGYDFPFNSSYSPYVGSTHELNISYIIEK